MHTLTRPRSASSSSRPLRLPHPEQLALTPPPAVPTRPELSERELQVLRLIANGRSNSQIARELHLSAHTVKTHTTRIFKRLGVVGREHAVALGFCWRLLTPHDVRRPS